MKDPAVGSAVVVVIAAGALVEACVSMELLMACVLMELLMAALTMSTTPTTTGAEGPMVEEGASEVSLPTAGGIVDL